LNFKECSSSFQYKHTIQWRMTTVGERASITNMTVDQMNEYNV